MGRRGIAYEQAGAGDRLVGLGWKCAGDFGPGFVVKVILEVQHMDCINKIQDLLVLL